MSRHEYEVSKQLCDQHGLEAPFYALIMAAMRQADSKNVLLLRAAFPEVWDELSARYNAPGGILLSDPHPADLLARGETDDVLVRGAVAAHGAMADALMAARPVPLKLVEDVAGVPLLAQFGRTVGGDAC